MNYKLLIINYVYIILFVISCDHEPFPNGKRIYEVHCENCHMSDGSGLPLIYPNLRKSDLLNSRIDELPCLILTGRKSEILETVEMPGVELSSIDMSNLVNYLVHKWNLEEALTITEIEEVVRACE